MARQRTLHPDFFTDEKVVQVSAFARLMFQGLWCVADREGRLVRNPLRLKMQLFPNDAVDGEALLSELENIGLVRRYEVDGRAYLYIPNFRKRQHVHPKEVASSLPAPSAPIPPPPPSITCAGEGQQAPNTHKARENGSCMDEEPGKSGHAWASNPAGSSFPSGPSGSTGPSVVKSSAGEKKSPAGPKPPKPSKPDRPPDPRHAPMVAQLVEVYREATQGSEYAFGGRDAKAVQDLLALGEDELIIFKWRSAIEQSLDRFHTPKTRTLSELVQHWNHYTAVKDPPHREMRL